MTNRAESLLSPSLTISRDQNDNLVNPIHISGRIRNHSSIKNILPSTMRDNADGTVSIYTSSTNKSGDRELFTEIPFTAIHGMQTRPRDDCDLFDFYTENLNEVCDGDNQIISSDRPKETTRSRKVTFSFFIATVAAATLQFLVGYNIVILNTPEKYVFPGHKTGAWSLAVAALSLGAPIGAIIGGKMSAGRGRRSTLYWNSILFFLGEILQAFAPNLRLLTMARLVIGVASGMATVLVPIYLGELAPPHLRGTLGTINQFAYVTGILAADLLSFRYATEHSWRHLFLMSVFISLIQLALLPFVVESPVWLIQKDPDDPTARQILLNLRGPEALDTIDKEFSMYVRAAKQQRGGNGIQTQREILMEMLTSQPQERYLFYCIFALHTAQQLCGISAVFYYSTTLFENLINNPLVGTTLIGAVNVIFTYVALLLMDSCRRKSLILWSTGGMFLACSTLVLAQMGIFGTVVALIAVNMYVAFYEIGVGPIPWLIIAEMFEPKYVTVIMSLISQWSWFVNFFVGLVFPTMHKVLGVHTFVPFVIILALSFLFTWVALPETHGKTPAQVIADVKQRKNNQTSVYCTAISTTSSDDDDREEAAGCYWNCADRGAVLT